MVAQADMPSNVISAAIAPSGYDLSRRTVRPIGVYALQGLVSHGDRLLAIDTIRGFLVSINPLNDDTSVLNPFQSTVFQDASGLALGADKIWFTKDQEMYWCTFSDFTPQPFVTLPYPADGIAVYQSTIYVTCQKSGYIHIFDSESADLITRLPMPGIGPAHLTVRDEELWVSDRGEQTVYCMDRATGEVRYSVLTPFASPTGIAFYSNESGDSLLYVAYAFEEAYIRDNPNADPSHELTFRERTFVHPLHVRYDPERRCTLSNGYRIEMSYVEEISPLEDVELTGLEWRIALPAETPRQTIVSVEPIGMPFTEEIQEGQRVAVFKFDKLTPHEGRLFGWKAVLDVRGIKYHLTPDDVDDLPPLSLDFQTRYLVDDDELAMDTPLIQKAAKESIGTETNILRKILKIRNYVYDRLSYGIKPHIDTPDVALERGVGSCGEYVGILLALARLNGIACRTVGRYKCPPFPDRRWVPLEPDFNHVWIEFYVPSIGWLPMESNVDDVIEGGPYPTRFFMGLPWFHAEMSKGIPFETLRTRDDSLEVSIGELAINHIRFTILDELPPP